MEEILKKVYYDIKSPACYAGVEKILYEAKKINSKITKEDVKKFLTKQRTYTLHRDVKRKFRKLKTESSGLNTDWQADLAVFINISKYNDDFNYLLVCIDTLSRMIRVEPVKKKSPVFMIAAFEKIFKRSKVIPWKIITDKGLEFNANKMKEYWKEKDIIKINSENPILHAAMAERANRTIKDRLYKYMSEKGTKRWIDIIQELVNSINHSVNRTIGMRPIDVTYENDSALHDKIFKEFPFKEPKFKIGDTVRIEKPKAVFDKGVTTKFTDEIFLISKVLKQKNPIVYQIKDDDGEEIKGTFYEQDLCLASKDTTWRVEILETRNVSKRGIKGTIKEYFVHWIGYNSKYDSWIRKEDLTS